jgi:short-subunit dehydrogenase
MTFKEKYGNTALVAGASEGMGAAFAAALAAQGLNLVLVARRKEPLEATAEKFRLQYQVNVTTVACNLGAPDALATILAGIGDVPIDFLVYNAAMSYIGPYLAAPVSTHEGIAAVNMLAPMTLAHYFGGKMVERKRGGVVLMSSIAGFQGSGFLATYASTKAFNRILAESLWYEWKGHGIDVIGCCAGATATPGYLNTNPGKASALEPKPQTPEQVVEACLKKIGKVPSFISGTGNKLVTFLMQYIFSRKMAVNLISDGMRKMYKIKD